MDVNGFVTKLFETQLPDGYEFDRIEMNVSASDSADGGRLFFQGGSAAAKVIVQKNYQPVTCAATVWNAEPPVQELQPNAEPVQEYDKLYLCKECGKNYGRKMGKDERVWKVVCKECKDAKGTDQKPETPEA